MIDTEQGESSMCDKNKYLAGRRREVAVFRFVSHIDCIIIGGGGGWLCE